MFLFPKDSILAEINLVRRGMSFKNVVLFALIKFVPSASANFLAKWDIFRDCWVRYGSLMTVIEILTIHVFNKYN